ncbi:CDP-diacylglycerol--glycerol-3-phosphate 3-phosphatidyltransferase [Anianabacter salinae]|uniref:CDP-diacylglycerol--glycerol-3-phosphate 3-phosphatidyltransferase n=1 Tax=Anianabacter salinae TaxID=2851023 RepID=UPI00225E6D3F|nr:CDP-diacylglycerol--glycerol-3-phosphate 3-phosphatidyltransferase [Anianabacter salinae]MBV0910895.1 CDP-diacylglycerol--glycerol-3-phosphate 3-phosphatidyltransferase [Anianabacter salinae]
MTWTLPNTLTVIRLATAPGLALVFLLLPRPLADWAALILFVGAAATDWLDGRLARAWGQESAFGAMLDPIADKAMVALALLVVAALSGLSVWTLLPASLILFREVFVSGLREYLGAAAGLLKVTRLAKWKTTLQMTAISLLFAQGIFAHYFGMGVFGMDGATVDGILSGAIPDEGGLNALYLGLQLTSYGGLALLWVAAALTVVTGWDYFRKALPLLTEART